MKNETTYVTSDAANGAKFFEEFVSADHGSATPRSYGVRTVMHNSEGRQIGSFGARELILTEPVELMRCFKRVTLKASAKKPVLVKTYLYPLGGRE